jgi:TP901 family phage tail tape measure protein
VATVANLFIRIAASSTEFEKTLKNAEAQFNRSGAKLQSVGATLTKSVSLPLLAIGGASVKAAVEFEASFAGIRKTVDGTKGDFAALAQGMRDMAKEKPVNVNELNRIGEIGGQLGIAKDGILAFTDVVSDMTIATEMSAEQAAFSLARIAKLTETPTEGFRGLGDMIAKLGDDGSSTEGEIAAFGERIAGVGHLAGFSSKGILATGAAMANLGIEADAGGTAVQKVWIDMLQSVMSGGKQLDAYGAVIGQTGAQFAQLFKQSPDEAFLQFVQGLEQSGPAAVNVLQNLGIDDARQIRAFAGLASSAGTLKQAYETAGAAQGKLKEEVAVFAGTAQSQFILFKNALQDVGITIGQTILPNLLKLKPALDDVIAIVAKIVEGFSKLPQPVQTAAMLLLGMGAASGPLTFVVGAVHKLIAAFSGLLRMTGIVSFIASLGKGLAALPQVIAGTGAAFPMASGGMQTFITALGTVGRVIVALSGPFGIVAGLVTVLIVTVKELTGSWTAAFSIILPPVGMLMKAWQDLTSRLGESGTVFGTLWQILKDIGTIVSNSVSPVLSAWGGMLVGIGSAVRSGLGDAVSWVATKLDFLKTPVQWLIDKISWILSKLPKLPSLGSIEDVTGAVAGREPKAPGSPAKDIYGTDRNTAAALALLDTQLDSSIAKTKQLQTASEESSKEAVRAAKAHADAIKKLSEGLSGASAVTELSDLVQAWKALPPSVQQSKPVIDRVLDGYMRLSADLTNVPSKLKPAVAQLNGMALAAGKFADNIDLGVTSLDGLGKAVDESGNSLLDSFDLWRDFADLIALETPGNAGANAANIGNIIGAMPDYGKPETSDYIDPNRKPGFQDAFSGIGKDLTGAIIGAFTGGGDLGNSIGAVIGSKLGDGLGNMLSKALVGAGGGGGMLGTIVGGFASVIPMFGPILAAVMGPIMDKVIDAIYESDAERAQSEIRNEWGIDISDQTAQDIEETMKGQFGGMGNNRWAAEVMHLGDIINDAGGIAADNIAVLEDQFRQAFVFLDEGVFSLADTRKVLDENFAAFAAYYTDRNELVSANVQELIRLDHQFGTNSEAVATFVEEQTNKAVTGLQTFLENAKITSQGVADSVGATIGGIFASLTQEGASPLEALTQLGPAIESFNAQLAQTGLSGGAAFAQIQALSAIATSEITGPMVQAVSGLNDVFTGLHNAGILTQEMFGGLSLQVAETFGKLQAQGVSAQDAMLLMQPSLQRIFELQKQFGYQVDASTQAMLDQAVAAGVVGEQHQSIQQQTLDVLTETKDVLVAMAEHLGVTLPAAAQAGATGVNEALSGIQVPDISVKVRPNWQGWDMPPQPDGPTGGTGSKSPTSSGYRPMATGGIVTRPMHALIGEAGPEAVIPLDEWKDSGPSIRIDRVYGTVDKAFVESIAKTVQLGGKPATAWRGVR